MNVLAATQYLALNLDGKTGIGWIGYIIIGGIAGWLASKFVKGGGSGILMDILIGVVGAFVAGLRKTRIAFPWPVGGMVKMPGALDTIEVCTGVEAAPLTVTTAGTLAAVWPEGRTSKGTCALT